MPQSHCRGWIRVLHSLWRQPGQDLWRHSLPPSQSGRAARVPPQGTEPVLSRIQLKIAPESLPRLDSVVAFTVAAARMRGRGGSAAALSLYYPCSGRYSTKPEVPGQRRLRGGRHSGVCGGTCGSVSWAERSLEFAQLSEWSGAGGRLGPGSVIKEINCPGSRTSKRSVYFFNSTKSVYQVTTVTSMSRQAPSLFGAASVPGSGCRAGNPGRAGCCRVAAV